MNSEGMPYYRSLAPECGSAAGPIAPATRHWLAPFRPTPREAEIVSLVLLGHSNASIGAILGISGETVKVHRRNLYAKIGITSQSELYQRFISYLMSARPQPLMAAE